MKRDIFIKIRVNADEMAEIKSKAEKAGMKISKYLRTSALACKIILYDTENIYRANQLLRSVGTNINQISTVVNSEKSVYKKDIEDLREQIKILSEIFRKTVSPLTCKEI